MVDCGICALRKKPHGNLPRPLTVSDLVSLEQDWPPSQFAFDLIAHGFAVRLPMINPHSDILTLLSFQDAESEYQERLSVLIFQRTQDLRVALSLYRILWRSGRIHDYGALSRYSSCRLRRA